ncbi:MAG: hypothetical protein H7X83_12280 [Verrucomicrobia bacterium]|nr:hypothetical protein [Deltaproteobacteria bacterium]
MPALDKKISDRLTSACGLACGVLFVLLITQDVDARDFFSKQYGLACKKCHTKIPNLKQFGKNFKDNGYSLEKRVPRPKETPKSAEPPIAVPQLAPIANTEEGAGSKSKEDSALQKPSAPPADKIEYLYRGKSKDGTAIFTDNPLHNHGGNAARETRNTRISPKASRRGTRTSKTAFSVRHLEKDQNSASDSARTGETRGRLEPAGAQQPPSPGNAQPVGFEACMEKMLLEVDQPQNVKDMMELFEMSERSCAPYAARR